jgi:hypothetical protein
VDHVDAVEDSDGHVDDSDVASDGSGGLLVDDQPAPADGSDPISTELDHDDRPTADPRSPSRDTIVADRTVEDGTVDHDTAVVEDETTVDDGMTDDDITVVDDDITVVDDGMTVVDDDTPVNEPAPAGSDSSVARSEPDTDEASDRILEELRRAQIDGPVVAFAPQDETTAVRRRPRQAADYDPAPVPIPAKVPRVLGRKARVRRVTRVVRHVDPWSVFKIALVANFVMYVIVLTASVLLWNVAYATGTIDNIERFFESFGWNTFEFNGGELYHAGWIAGLFVVIGFTGLAVLGATLFNLITDLVGGVRLTVLEEEVVETRQSPMRRFVVRRSEPEVPAVIRDGSGAMYREAVVDDTGANTRPTR